MSRHQIHCWCPSFVDHQRTPEKSPSQAEKSLYDAVLISLSTKHLKAVSANVVVASEKDYKSHSWNLLLTNTGSSVQSYKCILTIKELIVDNRSKVV